jgi:ABC-2 type transport system permease protein
MKPVFLTAKAVTLKNRIITNRAYPLSSFTERVVGSIFSIIFPVFIYYFIFNCHISESFTKHANTMDYLTYIVLGQSVNIIAVSTLMSVGRCMITEIREGTLDNFLLSPASRIGYFLGSYVEQFLRSMLEFSLVLLVGITLGARIPAEKIPIIALFIIFMSLVCFCMAILISTIMVFTKDTYITQNTFFLLIDFICGVLFPVECLPHWLQYISQLMPLTSALKAFRNCILGNQSLQDNWILLAYSSIISIVFLAIGYCYFRKFEKKLIENIYV